jgi:hypothetical protein
MVNMGLKNLRNKVKEQQEKVNEKVNFHFFTSTFYLFSQLLFHLLHVSKIMLSWLQLDVSISQSLQQVEASS